MLTPCHQTATEFVELLVASGAELQSRSVLLSPGVPLDIIDVPDPITDASNPLMAAQRWGLDHSSLVHVTAIGPAPVSATLPVAEPAALIAMKAHALDVRKEPLKRATDGIDIGALVGRYNPSDLANELASAPGPLPSSTMALLQKHFVTHADVTQARARLYSTNIGMQPLSQRDISKIGDILSEMRSLGIPA